MLWAHSKHAILNISMKASFLLAACLLCTLASRGQYNQFWGIPLCKSTVADVRAAASLRGASMMPAATPGQLDYRGTFDGHPETHLIFFYLMPHDMGQKDSIVYGAFAIFEECSDSTLTAVFQQYARAFATKYDVPCSGCDSETLASAPQKIREGGQNLSLTWKADTPTDPYQHTIRFESYKMPKKRLVLGCINLRVAKNGEIATGMSLPSDLKNAEKDY